MKNKPLLILAAFFLLGSAITQAKEKSEAPLEENPVVADPTPTPAPLPTATPVRLLKPQNPSRTLIVHKPRPSPAWGKIIQYHRDQILALSEKNREVIHEFVFQDEEGIVRTATFHENASGEGYWEVWAWDQP